MQIDTPPSLSGGQSDRPGCFVARDHLGMGVPEGVVAAGAHHRQDRSQRLDEGG